MWLPTTNMHLNIRKGAIDWPALNHGYGFPSKTTLDLACLNNGTGLARQWQWDVNEIGWHGNGMAMAWQGNGNDMAMNWLEERKNNTYAGFRVACPPWITCLLSVVEQKAWYIHSGCGLGIGCALKAIVMHEVLKEREWPGLLIQWRWTSAPCESI